MHERIAAYFTATVLKLLSRLPLRTVQQLGANLGAMLYAMNAQPVKITRANIRHCFAAKTASEQEHLVKSSIQATAMTMLEFSHMWHDDCETLFRLIKQCDGEHLIEQALLAKQPIMFLGPHLGNWELTGLYLSKHYNMASMYRPAKMTRVNDQILAARSRAGAELVSTSSKGVARFSRILKKNGCIGLLPDQVPAPGSAEYAPFFGHTAHTMTLASRLAAKYQPVVLLAFCLRLEQAEGFTLCIRKVANNICSTDLHTSLTAMNLAIEQAVREAPTQYQWEYKRFRRLPEGHTKLY